MKYKKNNPFRNGSRRYFYTVVIFLSCLMATGALADSLNQGHHPLKAANAIRLRQWSAPSPEDAKLVDPLSKKGQSARGLYFNGVVARRIGAKGIIRSVQNARLDAAVIDLKDGEGRILYKSNIDILKRRNRPLLRNAKQFFGELKRAGIYTIGRIVCFSDPILPRAYPERAVMDGRPRKRAKGIIWASWGGRNTWLDPYNPLNHKLIVDLAKEAEALGVDEIQLDYIRFPVDETTSFAIFPSQVDIPRKDVLLGLLRQIDRAISIPIGVDVFGLTAFRKGDIAGLGQSLEDWSRHVEVFTPMLYINGMGQWMRGEKQQRAMRLVSAGIGNIRRRLGHGPVIRPFLQAFSQGADYYNPEFIAEQIRGAMQGGADGFLFWHPGSNYLMVRSGMQGPARKIGPFPIDERSSWRLQAWSDRMSPRMRTQFFRRIGLIR